MKLCEYIEKMLSTQNVLIINSERKIDIITSGDTIFDETLLNLEAIIKSESRYHLELNVKYEDICCYFQPK